jgi:hypothetical protein
MSQPWSMNGSAAPILLSLLGVGKAYLADLGVNALELLRPADNFFKRRRQ